ncbi:TolB amino-terminal domain-containing protein [Rhodospirillales bacterium URHD0017]|nr:TolB amino-terminal domain-containing protein [Rhodospirillales bacterium URHD0017]
MREKPVERRLAAILAADVVGYSRLMGVDDVGTLRALQACRKELTDPEIAARGGRIVKTTGDGMLVEFASAVQAVACAVTIQRGNAIRNEPVPQGKRLTFRIGINVGDIIIDSKDIFGDGVNVAARLETLCEPGGLCISGAAHDQIRDKLPITFEDLGEQTVKNISRPVRAFALAPQAIAAAPVLPPGKRAAPAVSRPLWIAAFAVLVVALGAGAWWTMQGTATTAGPAAGLAPSATATETGRASIAVLPFTSPGGPGGDDYFADGMTEDIISALGRFRDLTVISRGGVFAYKGKSPSPAAVGTDLKVRYVVEGSIRRSPDRIRISVSLTDTARSVLVWSEKYDVEPKDVFSVQDQIIRQISGALAVRVTNLELARAVAKPPDSMEAYDLVLRGRSLMYRIARSSNAEARTLFERAIALDPNYAPAYVGLARVNMYSATQGWTPDPGQALERSEALARRAITLDSASSSAYAILGHVLVFFGDYDRALEELKRAIDLNPSDADAYGALTGVLLWTGDVQGAVAAGELLARFRPEQSEIELFDRGVAYMLADRTSDAVRLFELAVERSKDFRPAIAMLAAAYAQAGRKDDAERQAAVVRQRFPDFSRDEFGSLMRSPELREKIASAFKKAGL